MYWLVELESKLSIENELLLYKTIFKSVWIYVNYNSYSANSYCTKIYNRRS